MIVFAFMCWAILMSTCELLYALVFHDMPEFSWHAFCALPFILIGDVLNTAARKRMLRLVRTTTGWVVVNATVRRASGEVR